ncbi:hypothetical protein Q8F55_007537 [Vanrija albida]|uniref:Uncharacterized protein n=1 Tax=Vanrija albida TaxID=181172 RepID=A0ABR3PTV4_9TREE
MTTPDSIFPLEAPLKLSPGDYISEEPVTLHIKDKFLSYIGSGFNITNTKTGERAFKVESKIFSLSGTMIFESPDAKEDLFRLRYHPLEGGYFLAERLDMLDPNSIFSGPENMVMFTVEETKIPDGTKTYAASLYLVRGNKAVRGPRLYLRGGFDAGEVVLSTTGQVVAVISRSTEDAFGKMAQEKEPDSYFVTVAPGMDYAAVAGIAVCFNELHNKVSKSHTGSQRESRSTSRIGSRSASRAASRSRNASPRRQTEGEI